MKREKDRKTGICNEESGKTGEEIKEKCKKMDSLFKGKALRVLYCMFTAIDTEGNRERGKEGSTRI